MNRTLSWLALGDSYTIGEGCALFDNYPYQTTELLRRRGLVLLAPEIVAKTGWTTFELAERLQQTTLLPCYDIVSLLIGVNNQYRGLSVSDYKADFTALLQTAISLAGGSASRVFVLPFPDWGQTPFGARRDRPAITAEVAAFNAVNRQISEDHCANYVDVDTDPQSVVDDQLHPSAPVYKAWAEALAGAIAASLDKSFQP